MDLAGSRILVTGGGTGLGRHFAFDLAERGARVGVCDIDEKLLTAVAEEAQAQGLSLWTGRCNVAVEADVEHLFRAFVTDLGGIDAVVNNAGITRDGLLIKSREGRLEKLPLAKWQPVIDVDLAGVFLCGREAAYHLVSQGSSGVIVSISSISRNGNFGQTNYSAAKAGVAALTEVWAKELARYGIRAGAVAPGLTATAMALAMPEGPDRTWSARSLSGAWRSWVR